MSNTSSFAVPQTEGNEHVDVDEVYVAEPLLRQDVWAAKLSNRSRKEATATDVRQYAKQFLEAKLLEYKSWKENEVFELVVSHQKDASEELCHWTLGAHSQTEG